LKKIAIRYAAAEDAERIDDMGDATWCHDSDMGSR
jgi:hypothetical protein